MILYDTFYDLWSDYLLATHLAFGLIRNHGGSSIEQISSVVDLDGRERFHGVHLRSKDIWYHCSIMHNNSFELVSLGDFNINKNNLEENQGFVKLTAKPQLGRNEDFFLFPSLVS